MDNKNLFNQEVNKKNLGLAQKVLRARDLIKDGTGFKTAELRINAKT